VARAMSRRNVSRDREIELLAPQRAATRAGGGVNVLDPAGANSYDGFPGINILRCVEGCW